MFLFTRQTLETRRNRLGERPYMFAMQAEEAWDIDEEMDFSIVDLLLKQRQNPAKV
jgi:CMP-N-acetylneuraminic acid synthetase